MYHLSDALESPRGNSDLSFTLENLGVALPSTGTILNIGSGDAALFERQAALLEPDLCVISLDPNLVWQNYRDIHLTENFGVTELASADKVVALAGISQKLPFKDEAFDMVMSHAAVPTYLQTWPPLESHISFIASFEEVNRVLKLGSRAVMGPMEEPAFERSVEVLDSMGFKHSAEEIPVQDYSHYRDPWFRISFDKQ